MRDSLMREVAHALEKNIDGDVRLDPATRVLYSTDASIYRVEPLGAVIPRSHDDLAATVEIAYRYGVPLLPRGSGSSLAGQAVGAALVIDCSRHLNRILEIDAESRTAVVEPGVVLDRFNQVAAAHGLQFGPDPASSDRATFGGMLGNNSAGAHSLLYGMTSDHLLSVEVVLSDGSVATLASVPEGAFRRLGERGDLEGALYRVAVRIRERYARAIHERWPRAWRRASGYSLNTLFPWAPTQPPRWGADQPGENLPYPPGRQGQVNLAPLLVGSEGTLAVFRKATVNLVSRPKHTILGVLSFDSVAEASEATPALLELDPSAVELIPQALIRLARSVPAYANQLWFVQGDPAALLVVEFAGDDPLRLKEQVRGLGPGAVLAETPEQQNQVWSVRKVGLGLLMSRAGDTKPLPFIEDVAVPVENLGQYVRQMERIMSEHGTRGDFYAHASAGCLHMRPLVNTKTREGLEAMRAITEAAVELTLELGGALSGEHGDGLARAEWLERMYGREIVDAFHELKFTADPQGILNPGKVVNPPRMDENLRYGTEYRAEAWQPVFDFSRQGSLSGAIEMCNGAGVCRKDGGVMCPSFQATREEMHSTRGRANLLRAMISGAMPQGGRAEEAVRQALDLCLECKGCKAECPSAVDMAKLKYEFLHHYYQGRRRPLRDYLFAHIGALARLAGPIAPLANFSLGVAPLRWLVELLFGLAPRRRLPRLQAQPLREQVANSSSDSGLESVIFLSDPFSEYFYPQVGLAAIQTLENVGCEMHILPVVGAGRTFISKGFLKEAREHALKLIEALKEIDPEGRMPVVGVEPSEIYALRDEYLDFFPGDTETGALASRSYLIDEFLLRPGPDGKPRVERLTEGLEGAGGTKTVHLHGHCYQKAQPPAADGYPSGVAASAGLLEALGYRARVIDSGCCGMAGSFGYEAEHYDLSMQVGELALFPAVRAAGEGDLIAAPGVSCRTQIEGGTGREAVHPIELSRGR